MQAPALPSDEAARIAALRLLQILDTEVEERFDRITRLAARLFEVPICLVSLVDTDRQWFKSHLGLEASETPRNISFCGHAILGSETLQVEDTHADGRFSDNPLVTGEPEIRFYAGHPLKSPEGHRVGTLCLIDRVPRSLDHEQVEVLQDLARMVETELRVQMIARLRDQIREMDWQRRHAEEERSRLWELSLDLLAVTDLAGRFRQLNPAWEQITGFSFEELMSSRFLELVHADERGQAEQEMISVIRSGGSCRLESRVQCKDGRSRWILWTVVTAGEEELLLLIGRDITERKEGEEELLSHVSHELRTPLNAIYMFVSILADGLAGDVSPQQHEFLTRALSNVDQLKHLIGDLMESTRIRAGKLEVRRRSAELAPLLREIHRSLEPSAREKSIELHFECALDLPRAYADPSRIRQVVTNLIENAIKFTEQEGRIDLRARRFEPDPAYACVQVTDTGCGLSPEGTLNVFDRLYQEETGLESSRKGLGLGLYLCRQLIEQHGGRIWVESQLGEGSSFSFTIPLFSFETILRDAWNGMKPDLSNVCLLRVELLGLDGIPPSPSRETMLANVRAVLRRTLREPTDVLLPPLEDGDERGHFHVVALCGLAEARRMGKRLARNLTAAPELRSKRLEHRLDCERLADPDPRPNTSSENLLKLLAETVDQRICGQVLASGGARE